MIDAPRWEPRVRVIFLVPSPSSDSETSFLNEIFSELNRIFRGVTYSIAAPPVFMGWWVNPDTGVPDPPNNNVLVMIDANVPPDDARFVEYLDDLKRRLQEGLEQSLIWMTTHNVRRVNAFDPGSLRADA